MIEATLRKSVVRPRSGALLCLWALAGLIGSCRQANRTDSPIDLRALRPTSYRTEWRRIDMPRTTPAGSTFPASVSFLNASAETWLDPRSADPDRHDGRYAVRLSFRWWKVGEPTPKSAYLARMDLKEPLRPGKTATISVTAAAPAQPGRYNLQFDLLQEGGSWFESMGARTLFVPIEVTPG